MQDGPARRTGRAGPRFLTVETPIEPPRIPLPEDGRAPSNVGVRYPDPTLTVKVRRNRVGSWPEAEPKA